MRAGLAGEALGTFMLVVIGTGAVATAVLTGALDGLWQVAAVWAVGVTAAIFVASPLSGGHLNPAVSLALAIWRPDQFARRQLLPYWGAQLAGALLAGLAVWGSFLSVLTRFEQEHGLVRGEPGSERAAMIFGQYFPNPAMFGTGSDAHGLVSPLQALLVEAFGTAVLVLVVLTVTHPTANLPRAMAPPIIGLTVAALICVFAPLTQAGWNPARDLGPRLVAVAAGYGTIAIPGPQGGFWVYVAGPLLGGVIGGWIAESAVAACVPSRRLKG